MLHFYYYVSLNCVSCLVTTHGKKVRFPGVLLWWRRQSSATQALLLCQPLQTAALRENVAANWKRVCPRPITKMTVSDRKSHHEVRTSGEGGGGEGGGKIDLVRDND